MLRNKGYDMSTMLIVTEPAGKTIAFVPFGKIDREQVIRNKIPLSVKLMIAKRLGAKNASSLFLVC